MTPAGTIPQELTRLQKPALLAAAAGIVLSFVGLATDSELFFRAYLFGWLFILGLSLGSLAIVMLSHLVAGEWAWVVRRFGEAAAANLPLVAVLFIPIVFGLKHLYPWANPELVQGDHILMHRAPYMNPTWFVIRAIIYFAIWIGLAFFLRSSSLGYDRTGDIAYLRRARRVAPFGVLIYMITMSLASVDWIMTRDAHWFSHIVGFITVVGQAGAGIALLTFLLTRVADRDPIAPALEPKHLNDLGNLLMTLMILWAYMSFAQFLIIWMGNTKDDNMWYVDRGFGAVGNSWKLLALFLIVFHFFVPFFILLSRHNKRQARILGNVALWVLIMRVVDVYWWIVPTPSPSELHGIAPARPSWIDPTALLALVGIWLTVFVWQLKGKPLLARHEWIDPSAQASAGHAAHG